MARPRTGIHVLESHERVWRAHVLLVGGTAESHYFAQRQATFSHLLEAANVRVTTVHYLRDARADVDRIRAASDGMNVSHALLEVDHCDPLVVATLLDTGLPIVACTSGEAWPNARQPATLIDLNAEAAVVELAEHLVDIGRPLVGIQAVTRESSEALADTLAGHGLDTLVLDNRYPAIGTDCSRVASLEESGYRTVHQLILGGDLPVVLLLADDHIARGGYTALLAGGVAMPRDLQLVVWANRDNPIKGPQTFTRIENDATEHGRAIARAVLATVDGGEKQPAVHPLNPMFIPGETTGI